MLKIENIKMEPGVCPSEIEKKLIRILGLKKNELTDWRILKKAIDARNKKKIRIVYNLLINTVNEERILKNFQTSAKLRISRYLSPQTTIIAPVLKPKTKKVIIAGAGPCGLFSAMVLAENGLNPLIIERGNRIEKRIIDKDALINKGILDPESNIQFGEGGAGTFSDGKIYSGISDPFTHYVYDLLVRMGAPEEIVYDARPHIGTDNLITVVKNLHAHLISKGASFLFNTRLSGLMIKNDQLTGIGINNTDELPCDHLLLSTGHSARDVFKILHDHNVRIEQKAFSIGLRIEHPRDFINEIQYGSMYKDRLPAASYRLSTHLKNRRSVYTFCMCPGGEVINSSSEAEGVVTNGMSAYRRDLLNSNSAILVTVNPCDFEDNHPLSGIQFQRKYERLAFIHGGSHLHAPVQKLSDFYKNKITKSFGAVTPSFKPGTRPALLASCLPPFAFESIRESIKIFDEKLKGFNMDDAVLTGVESRSSSPVRVVRNENHESSLRGLFPAGEGAGYAGGIISSAVDGIQTALRIIARE